MTLTLVKLLVAPANVVATSPVGRRFGSGVSGDVGRNRGETRSDAGETGV